MDGRDVRRRAILLALVATCALLVACDQVPVGKPATGPLVIDAATLKCPPADGYSWKPWVKPPPTTLVMWVQTTTEQDFVTMCGAPIGPGGAPALRYPGTTACMRFYQDVNIVYAQGPRSVYSEAFEIHESCHVWGYHGEPPMRPAYR